LLGFAEAPFTLASYLIEGGPSRHHERTKALMHSQPDVGHGLLNRLAELTLTFLRVQAAAGVDAVQLFDSWAGALSQRDYRRFVFPHSARVLAGLADTGLPRIHFGVGTGKLLGAMDQAGADVIGVTGGCPWTWLRSECGPLERTADGAPGQPRPGRAAGRVACRRGRGAPGDRGGALG
jgi:uroporphyrinogen decarboxylase